MWIPGSKGYKKGFVVLWVSLPGFWIGWSATDTLKSIPPSFKISVRVGRRITDGGFAEKTLYRREFVTVLRLRRLKTPTVTTPTASRTDFQLDLRSIYKE